jgi:hypothetical protein
MAETNLARGPVGASGASRVTPNHLAVLSGGEDVCANVRRLSGPRPSLGRRPDDQISLGHIQTCIEQARDDADQPRVAGRSTTPEHQRSPTRGRHLQ